MIGGSALTRPSFARITRNLAEQVEAHGVGFFKADPQTVQGDDGIVDESAATLRGGGIRLDQQQRV